MADDNDFSVEDLGPILYPALKIEDQTELKNFLETQIFQSDNPGRAVFKMWDDLLDVVLYDQITIDEAMAWIVKVAQLSPGKDEAGKVREVEISCAQHPLDWNKLPGIDYPIEWSLRDALPSELQLDDESFEPMAERVLKTQRLAARITACQETPVTIFGAAEWAIPPCLESSLDRFEKVDDYKFYFRSACEWIKVAGAALYDSEEQWPVLKDGESFPPSGDLWKGKPAFCRERWALWKERLKWLVDTDDKDVTTGEKVMARNALETMGQVDGTK